MNYKILSSKGLQYIFGAFSLVFISITYYILFGGRERPNAMNYGAHFLGVALAHP